MRTMPSYVAPALRASVDRRIGELVREGKTFYYATLAGGHYIEHESFAEIAAFVEAEERPVEPVVRRAAAFLNAEPGAVSAKVCVAGRTLEVFRDGSVREVV
jgi:hypothetical protein